MSYRSQGSYSDRRYSKATDHCFCYQPAPWTRRKAARAGLLPPRLGARHKKVYM